MTCYFLFWNIVPQHRQLSGPYITLVHEVQDIPYILKQRLSRRLAMFDTHLSIPFGIIAGLFASFVQSLGLTIQRKSHVLNQALPEHRQRVEHRRPLVSLLFFLRAV